MRQEVEIRSLKAREHLSNTVREERDALLAKVNTMQQEFEERLEKKESELAASRSEIRREYAKRREEDAKAIRAEIKNSLAEEGVQMAEEVEQLRFQVNVHAERVQEQWDRSAKLETEVRN